MGFDAFLDVQGIKGESKDSVFPNKIEIASFSFKAEMPRVTGPGESAASAGVVKVQDLLVTKKVDSASVPLARALAEGQKIPKVELIIRKAGGGQKEYMRYTMEDVFVTSVVISGATKSEHDIPLEYVTLNFRKVTIKYAEQTERGTMGGPLVYTFDLAKPPGG